MESSAVCRRLDQTPNLASPQSLKAEHPLKLVRLPTTIPPGTGLPVQIAVTQSKQSSVAQSNRGQNRAFRPTTFEKTKCITSVSNRELLSAVAKHDSHRSKPEIIKTGEFLRG
jgi:hypothetical protein